MRREMGEGRNREGFKQKEGEAFYSTVDFINVYVTFDESRDIH